MTCAHCDTLKAQLAEAREALAAWEAYDAEEAGAAADLDRLTLWRAAFRLTVSEALILLALVDAAGRPLSEAALFDITRRRAGRDHAEEVDAVVVRTFVYRLRQALGFKGVRCAILTLRGVGYYVPTSAAAALRERVDG